MASDANPYRALMTTRIDLVVRLTELNSRRLSTEGRLGGIDFEMARRRDAADGATDGVEALRGERRALLDVREDIDRQCEELEADLARVDARIGELQ